MEETGHLWKGIASDKYKGMNFNVQDGTTPEEHREFAALELEVDSAVDKLGAIDTLKQE